MSSPRLERIRSRLQETFQPVDLLVKDQSHLHAGHAGSKDGKGHFEVHITAEAFAGLTPVQAHRHVFKALDDMMQTDIHALKIRTSTP